MAKQTFTTGQVLTAAQMTSLQQTAMGGGSTTAKTASYVLVAADAGTVVQMNSGSATTITVNTALFAAGDTVQIQNIGAGVCTVTAGTATVSTSATLALKQYDSGDLYFNTTRAAFFFSTDAADGASPLTTKGDVYTFSTVDARLAVGANNTVLTADSAQATGLKWATATGKVVQIVYGTTTTAVSNSTSTDADTNLTATITPSSASNSVLVLVTQGGLEKSSGNANSQILIKLFRSATNIGQIYGAFTATALQLRLPSGSFSILDAPSTTSATTYKTMFQNPINAADVSCQVNSSRSSIVLIEVTP